jgi:hypothetical protein
MSDPIPARLRPRFRLSRPTRLPYGHRAPEMDGHQLDGVESVVLTQAVDEPTKVVITLFVDAIEFFDDAPAQPPLPPCATEGCNEYRGTGFLHCAKCRIKAEP